jgi:GDP-4-dehydro-6-deoxy-D-mannose reductase
MKALITGITGFAGSHLAENLLAHNIDVCGTTLKGESRDNTRAIRNDITIAQAALEDINALRRAVNRFKPNWVFHLAAWADVGKSFDNPIRTMEVNLMGTLNLFEVLRDRSFIEGIVFVSSADVFGPLPPSKMPIKPDYPLQPVSPYGVSKAAADLASYQYFRAYGLPVIRVRAFNHTGPRQQTGYMIPDFCSQIVAIERSGKPGSIRVGDLSARRDLADVRDIVNGYRLAAAKGRAGEAYILATGKAATVESYLRTLVKGAKAQIEVATDKSRLRPVEVPLLVGDISKARKRLGYRPQIPITQTLSDTMKYWRDLGVKK